MAKFCSNCGAELKEGADVCLKCGKAVSKNPNFNSNAKSRIAAGLFGIFLGALGIHNFYLGYKSKAIAQLLIFNSEELFSNLINLIRDECHNDKVKIMSLIILGKVIRYNHEEIDKKNEFNDKINVYENQLKEIIELNLLNSENINETLKKTFKIILSMLNEE